MLRNLQLYVRKENTSRNTHSPQILVNNLQQIIINSKVE